MTSDRLSAREHPHEDPGTSDRLSARERPHEDLPRHEPAESSQRAETAEAAADAAETAESEGLTGRDGHEGLPLGGRTPEGDERAIPEPRQRRPTPLLSRVQEHERTSAFIAMADEFLDAQGFTEHGFRHANLVGHIAYNVLAYLGHDEHVCELAAVSGYLHDVGNVVSRAHHGQTSALLALDVLKELDVAPRDMAQVMAAVGNHEEDYGVAVSPVAAAVILADKSDVHRSRVRKDASIDMDIHDRVNFAVEASFLRVDPSARTLTLELDIDTGISQVLEYFEIFLERMIMCRRAARTLSCDFKITVNDVPVL